MNSAFDSVKPKSKNHIEDFYFDLETPRGHFFAVLDFATHDYANLNATLKGKLETIVGSFVSLSKFSADLFLGFTAKEINNFLYTLGQQSGGPELLCSSALCLLNGNRLAYLCSGDVRADVLNNGRLTSLHGGESEAASDRLGKKNQDAPVSEEVQTFTLQEDDVVFISTSGVTSALGDKGLESVLGSIRNNDPAELRDALMKATADATDDRTVVVISGPYERYVEPVLADLTATVTALESRLNVLEANAKSTVEVAPLTTETNLDQQMEILKDDLRSKAAKIDLLELEERIKNVAIVVAGKADTAEVLTLQSEVLKLGIAAHAPVAAKRDEDVKDDISAGEVLDTETKGPSRNSLLLQAAAIALIVGLGGAFLGSWLYARSNRRPQERWSVKSSGTQITIARLDEGNQGNVTMTVPQPVSSNGEQTFSSFADARRYIDSITTPAAFPQAQAEQTVPQLTEITVKPGDSLKKLAEQYKVPAEKIMELNPTVTRWPAIRIGQRITVPAAPLASPAPSPSTAAPSVTPATTAGTIEVIVAPGDSINRFALKYRTTPERLKELNPNIVNWSTIQTGQKVIVPNIPVG